MQHGVQMQNAVHKYSFHYLVFLDPLDNFLSLTPYTLYLILEVLLYSRVTYKGSGGYESTRIGTIAVQSSPHST